MGQKGEQRRLRGVHGPNDVVVPTEDAYRMEPASDHPLGVGREEPSKARRHRADVESGATFRIAGIPTQPTIAGSGADASTSAPRGSPIPRSSATESAAVTPLISTIGTPGPGFALPPAR